MVVSLYLNHYLKQDMLTWEYIPYNGNHLWKKSSRIAFFAVVCEKTFAIQVISLYKNSSQDRKCKKTLANASRFAKFVKLFFRRDSRYTVPHLNLPLLIFVPILLVMKNLWKHIFTLQQGPLTREYIATSLNLYT